jgi:hypothetical protein
METSILASASRVLWRYLEVAFTYPEPKTTGEHFGLIRCPLNFSQPVSRISFNRAEAKRPFSAANRELAISSDQILEGLLKDLNKSDLVSQVKSAIIESLPSGTPSEEQIAKQVFVCARTLQRRLSDESTSSCLGEVSGQVRPGCDIGAGRVILRTVNLVPARRVERRTYALRMRCSTS